MSVALKAAAIYNILWGAWVILFPFHFFDLVGMESPRHAMIWQGMGMVIGVYGLGYWWASFDPVWHWLIGAVGFLGKIFGPIGFIYNFLLNAVPAAFAYTLISNDFIWWLPFFLILRKAYQAGWPLTSPGPPIRQKV